MPKKFKIIINSKDSLYKFPANKKRVKIWLNLVKMIA